LLQAVCKPFLSDDVDRVERGLLGGCVAIALLGAGSQFGAASDAKGATVTAMYFVVLVVSVLCVTAPMRRIWRGGGGGGGESDAADGDAAGDTDSDSAPAAGDSGAGSGATGIARVPARRGPQKRFVV